MIDICDKVIMCLPREAGTALSKFLLSADKKKLTEMRFRAGAPCSLSYDGKNLFLFGGHEVILTGSELALFFARLTEQSVHSFSENMKEGFVTLSDGVRVGVASHAVISGGKMKSVRDISSVSIRIPHIIRGVAAEILPYLSKDGRISSALFYSPPGVAKTTVLRDIAATLSSGARCRRVAVVDTRSEIYIKEMFAHSLCDFLDGYPRAEGIECATRTLSPEVIITDEIGAEEDARAILSASLTGVPLIASAHAEKFSELLARPCIKLLYEARIFRYYIGISRTGEKLFFDIFDGREAK